VRPYVTIWEARCGDGIYIRSAHGAGNPWFRRAREAGRGRISADGVEADVVFEAPEDDVHPAIAANSSRYLRLARSALPPRVVVMAVLVVLVAALKGGCGHAAWCPRGGSPARSR
jgi:hypothetical protein